MAVALYFLLTLRIFYRDRGISANFLDEHGVVKVGRRYGWAVVLQGRLVGARVEGVGTIPHESVAGALRGGNSGALISGQKFATESD